MPEILTTDELAERLKTSASTLRRLTREGKVPSLKLGGEYRYDWAAVSASIQSAPLPGQRFCDHFGDFVTLNPSNIAPWPDFSGAPIAHGATLEHGDGTRFIAVRLPGVQDDSDAWRAVYADASVSRLGLQIGDRGQARVVGV